MILTYSLLTADYFRDQFADGTPSTICDTAYSCFMYSINLGLRNGGGLGDSMNLLNLDNESFNFKLFFD